MTKMVAHAARLALAASLLLLSGCLTSDGFLFDSGNANSEAFTDGAWRACEIEGDAAPDCKIVDISHNPTGLYKFVIEEEDEEATLARFRSIGGGAYAAQLWGAEDDSPFYFLVTSKGLERTFSMIDCENLPASFKKRYSARGEIEVQDKNTCVAKTAGAVAAAARAWRRTAASKSGSHLVYTPAPAAE
jgi:hypothetical protein